MAWQRNIRGTCSEGDSPSCHWQVQGKSPYMNFLPMKVNAGRYDATIAATISSATDWLRLPVVYHLLDHSVFVTFLSTLNIVSSTSKGHICALRHDLWVISVPLVSLYCQSASISIYQHQPASIRNNQRQPSSIRINQDQSSSSCIKLSMGWVNTKKMIALTSSGTSSVITVRATKYRVDKTLKVVFLYWLPETVKLWRPKTYTVT